MEKGISLVETIISLTLSLFILLLTSMFVDFVRKESSKEKENMEDLQELCTGIDRVRFELRRCGLGLSPLWEKENFEIFKLSDNSINLRRANKKSPITVKSFKGEKKIVVEKPEIFKEGREVIITDFLKFEWKKILKIENGVLELEEALENDYSEDAEVIQINCVSFKYDSKKKILRMSQNSGPYQPLIEKIENCSFKKDGNIIVLSLLFNKKSVAFKFLSPFRGGL